MSKCADDVFRLHIFYALIPQHLHICISSHFHHLLLTRDFICSFAFYHICTFNPWLKPDPHIFVRAVALNPLNGLVNALLVNNGIPLLKK